MADTKGGVGGSLTAEQLESFNSQGFLFIESFADKEEIDELRKRMEALPGGFDGSLASATVKTRNKHQHSRSAGGGVTGNTMASSNSRLLELLLLQSMMSDNEARQQAEDQRNRLSKGPQVIPALVHHMRTTMAPNNYRNIQEQARIAITQPCCDALFQ